MCCGWRTPPAAHVEQFPDINKLCIFLDIYWNILTMHVPINVKSPNNISKWQMGFNSAFKGLTVCARIRHITLIRVFDDGMLQ